MIKRWFTTVTMLLMFIVSGKKSYTQVHFTNNSYLLPSSGFYTWLQKGVADMNADGLDDIVRADQKGAFFILYQQLGGLFVEHPIGLVQDYTPLSMILGDVDNNGYNDVLTGGMYNGVRIVKNNLNNFQIIRLPQDSIYTQASALADINNDGWLDVFVCNDDSTNGIWQNDKSRRFIRDKMGFEFSNVPLNRHSGNYGIVFTDFDNDGDLDAYLSKCSRFAPKDSTDQRRINQLFLNSNGVYTDHAKLFGMADSSQTWVTEFQDIDNDSDMDAFIANHYWPSRLMLNDGKGHFVDITAQAGLLGSVPDGILQALMRDFDNDGYVDLIVSGMKDARFFRNNGNTTFTSLTLPFLISSTDGQSQLRSFVTGDLNHDGFLDLYTSYYLGASLPDELWLNAQNTNHFLAINLKGTKSNRSAVGAKITLKANGKTQIREVRAGESYGISNTLTQHFGLGLATTIESIEINWPSGQRSLIENVIADQFLTIEETECKTICPDIFVKIVR